MKKSVTYLGAASALALGGCTSTMLGNTAEILCHPRLHCYQSNRSGDAWPAATNVNTTTQDSVDVWEAQTLKRLDGIAAK